MVSAIIVAAGKGTRMGPNIDKIFLEVAGRPVIVHTWEKVEKCPSIEEIILVVREGMEGEFSTLARQYNFKKTFRCAVGGKERQGGTR